MKVSNASTKTRYQCLINQTHTASRKRLAGCLSVRLRRRRVSGEFGSGYLWAVSFHWHLSGLRHLGLWFGCLLTLMNLPVPESLNHPTPSMTDQPNPYRYPTESSEVPVVVAKATTASTSKVNFCCEHRPRQPIDFAHQAVIESVSACRSRTDQRSLLQLVSRPHFRIHECKLRGQLVAGQRFHQIGVDPS